MHGFSCRTPDEMNFPLLKEAAQYDKEELERGSNLYAEQLNRPEKREPNGKK